MELVEDKKEYLDDFVRLNEEWISTYFKIEDVDRKLAANPYQVIENGGHIFSLVTEGEVIGVCALFNEGDGVYELARMAVSPNHQNKGCGDRLVLACLSKLPELKVKRLYLVSNTKLTAAIALYSKHGFKTLTLGQHPIYQRANIVMERPLP